jgi:hypothetical protein
MFISLDFLFLHLKRNLPGLLSPPKEATGTFPLALIPNERGMQSGEPLAQCLGCC